MPKKKKKNWISRHKLTALIGEDNDKYRFFLNIYDELVNDHGRPIQGYPTIIVGGCDSHRVVLSSQLDFSFTIIRYIL